MIAEYQSKAIARARKDFLLIVTGYPTVLMLIGQSG